MTAPHVAAVFGASGLELTADEAAFFRDADPFGFILFARNVDTPEQVRRLTGALREAVGRDAPVLVDQEGGVYNGSVRRTGASGCRRLIRWRGRCRARWSEGSGCATG
jgi:beta-glucosidase-like glycosyl hydrolase